MKQASRQAIGFRIRRQTGFTGRHTRIVARKCKGSDNESIFPQMITDLVEWLILHCFSDSNFSPL